jgi:hypothetical protein
VLRFSGILLPERLDWHSAIGNFMINFGALDLLLLDLLESKLSPDEFAKAKARHFRDRLDLLKKHLDHGTYPKATPDS